MFDQIKDNQSVIGVVITGIIFIFTYQFQQWKIIDAQNQNQYMYHKNEVIKDAIAIYQIASYDGYITLEEYTDLSDHALKIAVWSDLETYNKYIVFVENLTDFKSGLLFKGSGANGLIYDASEENKIIDTPFPHSSPNNFSILGTNY